MSPDSASPGRRATQDALTVLVDGVDAEQLAVVFGRYRDQLWELPLTWVVSSRSEAPEPPADAFFDRVVPIQRWGPDLLTDLITRRSPDISEDDAVELGSLLAPASPLDAVLAVQSVLLAPNSGDVLHALEAEQDHVKELPSGLRRLYHALAAVGPTWAGDQQLLQRAGISRSRATHGLRELQRMALVTAERHGRRVLYQTLRTALTTASVVPATVAVALGPPPAS